MRGGRVCLGAIAGAHGVKGLVKLKSFTAVPEDIVAYGPLSDERDQQTFALELVGRSGGLLLARIEGVANRDRAEALKGTRLYVARGALPEPEEEEYYHADLIGLVARDQSGGTLGRVKAVHSYGAGDILEIEGAGRPLLLPFTKAVVPEVDIETGQFVVCPPEEVEARTEEQVEGAPEAERD